MKCQPLPVLPLKLWVTCLQVIGDAEVLSKESQVVKNTQHPNYEEGFTFTLKENWAECMVEINVLENVSGKNMKYHGKEN